MHFQDKNNDTKYNDKANIDLFNIGFSCSRYFENVHKLVLFRVKCFHKSKLIKFERESVQKTDALNYLSSKLSAKAIKDDKLEEAEALVDQAETKSSKVRLLVDLAIGFEKKDTEESHKIAVDFMSDASDLINNFPESIEDANDIMKVVSGYAFVEPKRSEAYLTNLIYMANDILTAQALLAKYNKRSNTFKNGEIIFTQVFRNSYKQYGKAFGKLAEYDFEKAESIIGQFQRQDIQILLKLVLAQSVLRDKIGLEGNRPYSAATFSF